MIKKPYWYLLRVPNWGLVWSPKPSLDETVVKLKFLNRKLKRHNGRHCKNRIPKRTLKTGWYYEYLKRNWSVESYTLKDLKNRLIKVRK